MFHPVAHRIYACATISFYTNSELGAPLKRTIVKVEPRDLVPVVAGHTRHQTSDM